MKYFNNNLKFAATFIFLASISMAMDTVVQPVIEFTNNVAQGQVHFEYRIQRNYPCGAMSDTMKTTPDTYAPWQKYTFLTTDFGNPNYPLCIGDCIHLDKLIFDYQENNNPKNITFVYTNFTFVLGKGSTYWHDLAGSSRNDLFKWKNERWHKKYKPHKCPNWSPCRK